MRFLSLLLSSSLLLNQSLQLVSFSFTKLITSSRYASALHLNRIFCDIDEVITSGGGPDMLQSLILNLNETDYRYKHIKNILKLEAGDTLKGGIIGIGSTDSAKIIEISSDVGVSISLGLEIDLKSNQRPLVDLILAVPRPLRLERILSVVSCIGVGKLVLTGASKVQNDYFGSHLLRRPDEMKKCLVEGISQAAVDCFVPDVLVRRNFLKFVTDEIDVLFPADEYHRLIAHPPSVSIDSVPVRFNQLQRGRKDEENDRSSIESKNENGNENESENENEKRNKMKIPKKILVAVGPEGGWEDEEVNQLLSKGFFLASLGPRILRTDMAVSVLLGLAHDWTDNIE